MWLGSCVDKKRMLSKEQRVRNGRERIKAVENNIELHYLSRKTFFYNLDLSSHLLFIFSKYPSYPRNKYDPEMHLLRCFSVFCGFLFLKEISEHKCPFLCLYFLLFSICSSGNQWYTPYSNWLQSSYLGTWGHYSCCWREN
jgi:hypothetical protein